jgi:hypothetical protein
LIGSRLAELETSSASRRARVSSRFASITQKVLVRWYQGGWALKNSQARRFARNAFAERESNFLGFSSKE